MTAPEVVTVVVVSYDSAADLAGCLAGLAAQTHPRRLFEVVVVDNASRDGSADLVRTRFPWVQLVSLRKNLGFTGGNNAGAALARGGRVALINPDTVPDPHWLAELVRAADRSPHGQACSKLVFRDAPGTLNSAGLELLRDGRGADRGFRHADAGQHEAAGPVFAGCGAAVLLRTPPPGVPLFDPRLFLYCEDLDRGWRDRRAGGGMTYAPRSVVRHAVGAAGGSAVYTFYAERNRALVAAANGDAWLAVRAGLTLAAKLPQAAVRALRGRAGWATVRAVGRAVASYAVRAPGVAVGRLGWNPGVESRCG